MTSGQLNQARPERPAALNTEPPADATDGELLERFAHHQDEPAFAALVRRHGPMVLGVCRRVLHDEHDADDAFQATFLVLARQAGCIRKAESVASWLYGVAYRIALRSRAQAARRRKVEGQAVAMAEHDPQAELAWRELRRVLDEELHRLPAKYHAPLILCYLEGKTNTEAARELGWTKGTVSGRLARARDLLRERLSRRGLALDAGVVAVMLLQKAAVSVPPHLAAATVAGALLGKVSIAVATLVISQPVNALADDVLRTLAWRRFWGRTLAVLAAFLFLAGAGAGAAFVWPHKWGRGRDCKNDPATLDQDHDRLQGAWVLVSQVRQGRAAPAEAIKGGKAVFDGDTVTLFTRNGKQSWTFVLDAGPRGPRRLDLIGDKQTLAGIYRIGDDTLTLCRTGPGQKRPTDFVAPEWGPETLYVFRRETAGAAPP
jgi:RNA polymerase sigma factor (sigma-70 family)